MSTCLFCKILSSHTMQKAETTLYSRRRLYYILTLLIIIPLGLFSRKIEAIPVETGDALWAVMVFCVWRILLPRKKLTMIALLALATSFLDEFEQLLTWSWLVKLRFTTLGHLILGQGFLWLDLLAYTIGILVIFIIAHLCERQK